MKTPPLAEKLGVTPHPSPLLQKAQDLGLSGAASLEGLAVARGCWHYRQAEIPALTEAGESQFSNEELAIALLSPSHPYSPRAIRVGAAMLGAEFLIRHDRMTPAPLEAAFAAVVIPDLVAYHDAFKAAKPVVLKIAREAAGA
jgi:hypothetical protein